jgi:prevent-host-death family protein
MKTASITQTKNQLSALLDEVKRGEVILILDRGRPVARLSPAVDPDADRGAPGRLERLERQGVIRRAARPAGSALSKKPGARLGRGISVLEALLSERREGR